MTQFIWLNEYEIGNETVDQQHRYLFDLANQIVDPTNDAQKTHLNVLSLHHYVREHFAYEEALMRQCTFPGYERHIKEHAELIRKLNEIGTGIISGDIGPLYIQEFMQNWLLEHILKQDTQIASALNQQKPSRIPENQDRELTESVE